MSDREKAERYADDKQSEIVFRCRATAELATAYLAGMAEVRASITAPGDFDAVRAIVRDAVEESKATVQSALPMSYSIDVYIAIADRHAARLSPHLARGAADDGEAIRAAREDEKRLCCRDVCNGCRLDAPTYIENGDQVWHELQRSHGHSMDYPCSAVAIKKRFGISLKTSPATPSEPTV